MEGDRAKWQIGNATIGLCRPAASPSGMKLIMLLAQQILRLWPLGVGDNVVGRADELALQLVLRPNSLGQAERIDHVDRISLENRLIGARLHAGIAGRTVFGDLQRHRLVSSMIITGKRSNPLFLYVCT